MADWIIYYDDGSSFSSDDGPPDKAPKNGVQVVAFADINTGKTLWHSYDYYCWHKDGCWIPHTEMGLKYYLAKDDEPGIAVAGYWIPPKRWAEIYQTALDDFRLPAKLANDPREQSADGIA